METPAPTPPAPPVAIPYPERVQAELRRAFDGARCGAAAIKLATLRGHAAADPGAYPELMALTQAETVDAAVATPGLRLFKRKGEQWLGPT